MKKQYKMAYISYNKEWESEFVNTVSKKDKVQVNNNYQLKLQINDSCEKDEKITTIFKAVDDSDVINEAYIDEKLIKRNGHLSLLEKRLQQF